MYTSMETGSEKSVLIYNQVESHPRCIWLPSIALVLKIDIFNVVRSPYL